jgi:hypothetical protein
MLHKMQGMSLLAEGLVTPQEEVCLMDLVDIPRQLPKKF